MGSGQPPSPLGWGDSGKNKLHIERVTEYQQVKETTRLRTLKTFVRQRSGPQTRETDERREKRQTRTKKNSMEQADERAETDEEKRGERREIERETERRNWATERKGAEREVYKRRAERESPNDRDLARRKSGPLLNGRWTQRKLASGRVGSKTWWSLVKDRQGYLPDELIPPLNRQDGTTSTSSQEKADLFAEHFATKMQVPDPARDPPWLAARTVSKLSVVTIRQEEVHFLLKSLDQEKAVGPDKLSPRC
nr:uncharacterized protein LOC128684338 [Cherax quadricarinatus]